MKKVEEEEDASLLALDTQKNKVALELERQAALARRKARAEIEAYNRSQVTSSRCVYAHMLHICAMYVRTRVMGCWVYVRIFVYVCLGIRTYLCLCMSMYTYMPVCMFFNRET